MTIARRALPLLLPTLLAACETTADRAAGITRPTGAVASLSESSFSEWSTPQPLPAPINSSYGELQPSLAKDGLTLFFVSTRPENADDVVLDQNVWLAQRECLECPWGDAVLLGAPVNSASLEAAPSLSRDQHRLYFTSNRPGSQERDIYVAYRANVHDDFGWESATNLGAPVNTSAAEIAPSLFEDEEAGVAQLFFNRGTPGGDIWMSERLPDGTWGTPVFQAELNTAAYSEQRPSVSHDGRTIYFWSDRTGGARIFRATRESPASAWSAPEMVPSPIGDAQSLHPFIHSHGATETLFFSRTVTGSGLDLFVSTRTRGGP